jgi:hypothetical protein
VSRLFDRRCDSAEHHAPLQAIRKHREGCSGCAERCLSRHAQTDLQMWAAVTVPWAWWADEVGDCGPAMTAHGSLDPVNKKS